MRKDNVWKQAIALVLSAVLVVGNGASVSAAAGDTAAGNAGTTTEGTDDTTIVSPDAYKAVTFDFEDGEQQVSGDDGTYTESGITFTNDGVEIVEAPVVDGDSVQRGKALKFSRTKQMTVEGNEVTTGNSHLTTVEGALSKYDFSNGFTLSMDIYPDAQRDWNYIFGFGAFDKKWVCGTIGFIAAFGEPWTNRFPADGWLEGNEVNNNYNYFGLDENAHKWYRLDYVYTNAGLTIKVNDVPTVAFIVDEDEMKSIMQEANKGQLRIGMGTFLGNEGFLGYMDNVTIQPVHPGAHEYVDVGDSIEPASCTVPGSKKVRCTMCGVIATVAIPATGHTYVHHEAHPATCTEPGYIEHYTCSNTGCTGYFVSGDDGVQTTTSSRVALDATGHDYIEVVSEKATPTADGQIAKTCKNCAEGTTGHSTTETIAMASNIALENTSYTYTGKAIEPKVTVKDSKGNEIAVDNYTVTYENNKNVGTAKAIIEFKEDSQKYKDSVERNFKINGSLSVNKTKVTLYTGKSNNKVTLKATVKGNSNKVEWKSDKPKVAKVDKKGVVTALGAGKATITVKSNGVTQKVTVTVKNPTITVKNGKKKASSVTVKRGKKVTLTVTTNPKKAGNALAKLPKKDKKVASVTYKKGKITIKGKKKGSITIKITSGKAIKKIKVKVK